MTPEPSPDPAPVPPQSLPEKTGPGTAPPTGKSKRKRKSVAVIGGGPAGLFAAECLARQGHAVTVYDHMARPGRKFLMAGRSGLNLTHDEPPALFGERYGTSLPRLQPALDAFTPAQLRQWAEGLGQPCFTGSSGRVFLKSLKASPLLRAWLERLENLGVIFAGRHRFAGFAPLSTEAPSNDTAPQKLRFTTPEGEKEVTADATVLAMGGASWSRLGSDGQWAGLFPSRDCAPFLPANCGFLPDWPAPFLESFLERYEGETLRGIALSFGGVTHRGDLTITRRGLEGAPLYALSALLRDALLAHNGPQAAQLNLRPTLSASEIQHRLSAQRPRESRANRLRKALRLTPVERVLLNELAPDAATPAELAQAVQALPLAFSAPGELDRAISTAGGLKWAAVDGHFMLKDRPGVFACGEMLDWEAPTGGYLLQGCFSTAHAAAGGVAHWLAEGTGDKRPA
ncbi:TIGR03862 family flavoprotein [Oecophyllibacter saccharovorans]|uniref:TIGR03862 family flavoprotein n=1 Tax=Oecophyllibacter saccharovorans TaxID=2558360 RepID=UPI00114278F6|nr:TIGR03862 family flavoprotein [Oecophyllibacter saccharovorans]QDH15547.1 TIGR03862 family flavoprotein [Oecophyllibacter saccharovorans]